MGSNILRLSTFKNVFNQDCLLCIERLCSQTATKVCLLAAHSPNTSYNHCVKCYEKEHQNEQFKLHCVKQEHTLRSKSLVLFILFIHFLPQSPSILNSIEKALKT